MSCKLVVKLPQTLLSKKLYFATPARQQKKQKANKRARKNLVGGEKGIIQARMGKSISSHQFYVSIFMVKENDVNKLFYKLTRGIRDSFAG